MLEQDVPLPDEFLNLQVQRFSPEARQRLKVAGYSVYELTGQTLQSLRNSGRKFISNWHINYPALESQHSRLSEVAINPDHQFLAGSDPRTFEEQQQMVQKFSQQLQKSIGGAEAVIGEVADYLELFYAHFDTKSESIIGNKLVRTKTPISADLGNALILICVGCTGVPDQANGVFADTLGVWSDRIFPNDYSVWILPLIIPKENHPGKKERIKAGKKSGKNSKKNITDGNIKINLEQQRSKETPVNIFPETPSPIQPLFGRDWVTNYLAQEKLKREQFLNDIRAHSERQKSELDKLLAQIKLEREQPINAIHIRAERQRAEIDNYLDQQKRERERLLDQLLHRSVLPTIPSPILPTLPNRTQHSVNLTPILPTLPSTETTKPIGMPTLIKKDLRETDNPETRYVTVDSRTSTFSFVVEYLTPCESCGRQTPDWGFFYNQLIESDHSYDIDSSYDLDRLQKEGRIIIHPVSEFRADGLKILEKTGDRIEHPDGRIRYRGQPLLKIVTYKIGDLKLGYYIGKLPNSFEFRTGENVLRYFTDIHSADYEKEYRKHLDEMRKHHDIYHRSSISGTIYAPFPVPVQGPRTPFGEQRPVLKKGEVYYDPGGDSGGQWRVSDGKIFDTDRGWYEPGSPIKPPLG